MLKVKVRLKTENLDDNKWLRRNLENNVYMMIFIILAIFLEPLIKSMGITFKYTYMAASVMTLYASAYLILMKTEENERRKKTESQGIPATRSRNDNSISNTDSIDETDRIGTESDSNNNINTRKHTDDIRTQGDTGK